MKNKVNKILMTIPHRQGGGMMSFYNSLLPFLPNVDVLKRGVRDKKSSSVKFAIDFLGDYVTYIKILFSYKYKIIFINTSLTKICCIRDSVQILIAKIFRQKVLLYIHGFEDELLNKKWLCRGFLLSDTIIVLSKEFKNKIKSFGFKKPIYVSLNPVDKSIMNSFSESEFQNKTGKSLNNILFLSRIEEDKGIFILLEIFNLLKTEFTWLKLYIAGTGSVLNKAKDYVRNNSISDVFFLGLVEGQTKTDLLKKADIFLFPTYHKEGLPINVLEAMTAGIPVITRPVGGIKDFFQNNEMGYLVESLKPEDFVIMVKELINSNNYLKICMYNYFFSRNHFHPKIIALNLEKIINTVVDK